MHLRKKIFLAAALIAFGASYVERVYAEKEVIAGGEISMVLEDDAPMLIWGRNDFGQCEMLLSDIKSVSAGTEAIAAVDENGKLFVWGTENEAILGVPNGKFCEVSVGYDHIAAIDSRGGVTLWGSIQDVQTKTDKRAVDVASGRGFTIILWDDGTVSSVGENEYGACNLPELSSISEIEAGYNFVLALDNDGNLYSWGDNLSGQCDVPQNIGKVENISAGAYHCLAINETGDVIAWGAESDGRCDVPEISETVVSISAGYNHSMCVTQSGKIYAWGDNTYGESIAPSDTEDKVIDIQSGAYNTVAKLNSGKIIAWGAGGDGKNVIPDEASSASVVSVGENHVLAIASDGTVVAWGNNEYGQCDVPDTAVSATAVAAGHNFSVAVCSGKIVQWGNYQRFSWGTYAPSDVNDFVAVAAGARHAIGLRETGEVVAWGSNIAGTCTVPENMGKVVAIAASDYMNAALAEDGKVYCWGYDGQTVLEAEELENISGISAGIFHCAALDKSGKVIMCGGDEYETDTLPDLARIMKKISGAGRSVVGISGSNSIVAWGEREFYIPARIFGAQGYYYDYCKILNSSGQAITEMGGNKEFKAKIYAYNNTSEDKEISLMIASYVGERLSSVTYEVITLPAGEIAERHSQKSLKCDDEVTEVRVFAFSDLNSLAPAVKSNKIN